jgi:hypothetical protein
MYVYVAFKFAGDKYRAFIFLKTSLYYQLGSNILASFSGYFILAST